MRVGILYSSLSGNTSELAQGIKDNLEELAVEVKSFHIEREDQMTNEVIPYLSNCDLIMVGTWTTDYGVIPEEMEEALEKYDYTWVDKPVAVFGTGETQWGMEYFCGANDKIAKKYHSPFDTLKIEQFIITEEQENKLSSWVTDIVKHWRE
ncbi:flavodoxin [Listeria phage LP-125]|uniref:Flavodoxin n=4 Tax=Pecentumvirus TaxID=1857844 RepID=S4U686_9CAUD|nr:flavodoxin [Listeria phage LP-125]YP_009592673.1 flavodoxin [Listeria phage LP-064]QNL31890.1 flavodoxin [Listeria phage LP-Mix_6.1]QNL32088.1 flavodoxin [Listeria phage LP-Mix_6.2]AGI11460.1 flavodoxin [Listeria phage LP-125]AHL19164.1 flavodoxin [Listeria phage LP-064]